METGIFDDQPFGVLASYLQVGECVGLRLFGVDNASPLRLGFTNMSDKYGFYVAPELHLNRFFIGPVGRFGFDGQAYYGITAGFSGPVGRVEKETP